MDLNYRQTHYAFWRDYFPTVSARPPSKLPFSHSLYTENTEKKPLGSMSTSELQQTRGNMPLNAQCTDV